MDTMAVFPEITSDIEYKTFKVGIEMIYFIFIQSFT